VAGLSPPLQAGSNWFDGYLALSHIKRQSLLDPKKANCVTARNPTIFHEQPQLSTRDR